MSKSSRLRRMLASIERASWLDGGLCREAIDPRRPLGFVSVGCRSRSRMISRTMDS
jgi:hypothetical protein